jgi:hypothetical protein
MPAGGGRYSQQQIVAGGAYNPASDTPNLVAWWDFSDTATITESGGAVSAVNDKGPNNRDLVQSSAGNKPTTGTRTINSLNTLDFDGTTDYLNLNGVSPSTILGAAAAGTALYVFAIDTDPPSGNGAGPVLGQWGTDNTTEVEPYSDGNIYLGWGRTARITLGNPAAALTTPRQITIVSSASEWTYKIDGTNFYTTGTNTVAWQASTSKGYIGVHGNAGYFLDGRIGEIIISSSALSGTDLTNAQNYLKSKWGTA